MFTKRWSRFTAPAILCTTLGLAACGGGSSTPAPPPPTATVAAPSNFSYASPQTFSIGQAITPVTPAVTGTVTSYSVSPALSNGLTLNTTSGAISGTPTAMMAQTTYTVTATNSAGSATTNVVVTITDMKPATISYPSKTVALATNQPVNTLLTPSVADGGGTITSWSINPSLPAGLSFGASGAITGIPTADSPATAYTITAGNSGGTSTFVLTLSVQSGVLLDLGHADSIAVLKFDGTHVLSLDAGGHWVLWNYSTAAHIASGDASPCQGGCPVTVADLQGTTIALQTPTGFEIRSVTDGHVVTTIATTSTTWWKLATDGSYLVAGNSNGGLQVWNTTTGATSFTRATGAYTPTAVYAAPTELRAAITVGGAHVIETTSIATGTSTNSASFTGTFNEWFVDGNRFQSTTFTANAGVVTSVTAYTYSTAAVLQDTTTSGDLGNLQGTGDFFASYENGTLSIYKVGANGASPVTVSLSADTYSASGTMFVAANMAANGGQALTFIDVSGSTPAAPVVKSLPVGGGDVYHYTYAAVSASSFVTGTGSGVLFDGASPISAPRYLDYGQVWSIAGNGTRFAIATASGRVLHYNSATGTLENTISDFSSQLVLSADGAELAAAGAFTSLSGAELTDTHKTRIYTLPGDSVLSTWPANNTDLPPVNIDLSGNGSVLAQTFTGATAAANPASGGGATWSTAANCVTIHTSPDGSQLGCNAALNNQSPTPATSQLFANSSGSQGTPLTGWVMGWLDAGHILVNHYKLVGGNLPQFDHATVNDPTGAELSTSGLPFLLSVQVLALNSIYSQDRNAIYSVDTGATNWLSATQSRGVGAVAGSNVVFAAGPYVLSLPR